MAQTGFTPISNYYSATATNVPTAGNLVAGELAINTADGKLFYKDSAGVVQTLATKTAATFPNVNGSTSGAVTLAAPAVAGSNTATFPAATGTVMVSGNMPAFSAYNSNAQVVSTTTYTKIQFNTEEFDTNSCYDNATNYRFTPTVAGYYQVNLVIGNGSGSASGYTAAFIYKNGSAFKASYSTNSLQGPVSMVNSLIYLNGSTDYVEGYWLQNSGVNQSTSSGSPYTYFQASMVRAA